MFFLENICLFLFSVTKLVSPALAFQAHIVLWAYKQTENDQLVRETDGAQGFFSSSSFFSFF